ncbi:MAG: endonuclease/exonuclease/phosphatase family protein [Bacteroidaceae bacterium]
MGKAALNKVISTTNKIPAIVVIILSIMGSFGRYYDPITHPFMAYLTTVLPVLLLVDLFFFIFYISTRHKIYWLCLVAILANFQYLRAICQIQSTPAEQANDITIATYNVHGFSRDGMGYRARKINNLMRSNKVDIICMQEFNDNHYFTLDSIRKTFQAYPYYHIPKNNKQKTRVAIFSKYPIVQQVYLSFGDTDNCGQWVDILAKGQQFRVYNLHLQTTAIVKNSYLKGKRLIGEASEQRKAMVQLNYGIVDNIQIRSQQAREVAESTDTCQWPVIVSGDFNTLPSTYVYHLFSQRLKDGFISCGKGYAYSINSFLRLLRIDYIFHSNDITGVRYYSSNEPYSDHNPVFMRYRYQTNNQTK